MREEIVEKVVNQQQGWIDPLGDFLVHAVVRAKAVGGERTQKVLNFLHGLWLGHPFHPALTDVPIGAWTAAFVMDALDSIEPSARLQKGADRSILLGVAAGLGAASAGIADWYNLQGYTRRLGLTHGLLNVGAVSLYTTSLLLRRGKNRGAGVKLSMVAYAVASTAAYLGGDLVFNKGSAVNHTAFETLPSEFVPVLAEAELEEDRPRLVHADGAPVMLVRRHGRIHALGSICTHLGGPLAEGQLEDDAIVCPWHGSHFALDDGSVLQGPAVFPEILFEVRLRNGQIEVRPSQ